MIEAHKMSDQQLINWTKKTAVTISKSYWKIDNARRCDLVDRYTELKEELVERGQWEDYCQLTFSCPTHDAYDLSA